MTRVDFYLIENGGDSRDLAACKLIHKAFRLGHRIYLLTRTPQEAAHLDRLLWTFSAGSFIPHGLQSENMDPLPPVVLGSEPPPTSFEDVLITLAAEVPECFSRFQRVAEVVGADLEEKAGARERFRFYRDRGYPPQTHNLS
jgi:DNA polymerase-3 subunit chi